MISLCKAAMAKALAVGWWVSGMMGLALCFSLSRADAQSLRDPTLPPLEAGLASTVPAGNAIAFEPGAMTIIVRSGRPYLVVGTRLYAQGQQIGRARIERISESEIWLREGGVLRKVSRFPGIQRRAVTAPPTHRPQPLLAPTFNREVYLNDSKSSHHD